MCKYDNKHAIHYYFVSLSRNITTNATMLYKSVLFKMALEIHILHIYFAFKPICCTNFSPAVKKAKVLRIITLHHTIFLYIAFL